jgi:hypothetical protein
MMHSRAIEAPQSRTTSLFGQMQMASSSHSRSRSINRVHDYIEFFRSVRRRPGMYVGPGRYSEVVAFVLGYDAARSGGVLYGFREWLITRLGFASNLAWPGLVQRLAFADRPELQSESELKDADNRTAIDALFGLIEEFVAYRDNEGQGGLRRVILEYEAWLRTQSWYEPGSPQWIDLLRGSRATRRKARGAKTVRSRTK